MIKRFRLDEKAANGGPRDVLIVTADRAEMAEVMGKLSQSPGPVRLIYYDRMGRGAVELLIEVRSQKDEMVAEARLGTSRGWSEPRTFSCAGAREFVQGVFARSPEPEKATSPAPTAVDNDFPTLSGPVAAKPTAVRGRAAGQMCLF